MLIIAMTLLVMASPGASQSESSEDIDIPEVVEAVKNEIQLARGRDTGLPKLQIDRVELELKVSVVRQAGLGLSVKVASLNGAISQETTHRLTLTIVPVGQIPVATDKDLGLVPAIQRTKEAIRTSINTPPPFRMDTFILSDA